MSPPEVWGPAVWTLIHALTVRINDDAYAQVSLPLFKMIVNICKFLPCPECSADASNFLAKVHLSQLKSKPDLINTFYFFHNSVNSKKRKPLFKYSNLGVYGTYRLIGVVNNFIAKYNTKGNMKLIAESFQRQMILNQFRSWFVGSIRAFIPKLTIPSQLPPSNNEPQVLIVPVIEVPVEPIAVEESAPVTEEPAPVTEAPVVEAPVIEAPVTEEPVTEEPVTEEPVAFEEPVAVEEPVTEEPVAVVEEQVIEDHVIEEHVIEEHGTEEPVQVEPL